MTARSLARLLALAIVPLAACDPGGGGSDDEGNEPCPATGEPVLPELARVRPDYASGCEDESWASAVERPVSAWTIELERTSNASVVVPSSDGVVAITGRTARWIGAQGDRLTQRDIGGNVPMSRVQGGFDGRLALSGSSNGGGQFYRVFDASGTEIWLRLLDAFFPPSLVREGSDLLVGISDFTGEDTLLRIERWSLTGAKQAETTLVTWSDVFARDGQGRYAVLQDGSALVFDGEGTLLGQVGLGAGDYPYVAQIVGAEDGFYAAGGDSGPFVTRIRIEGAPEVAWTYRIGQPGDDWETANGLALLPDGGVVFVGGEATIGVRWPMSPLVNPTQPFVLALDEQGEPIWGERIAAAGWAHTVTVGAEGEVYVAGTAQAGPPSEYGSASSAAWLRRYDP